MKDLSQEILSPSIDLSVDYAELSLDEFIDDPVLKEVPIVKTLLAIVKTGIAVRDRFFIKKFLVFLSELHSDTLSNESLQEFQKDFENEKYKKQVLEHILVLVDQLTTLKKTRILGHLFKAHVEKKCDWERFQHLTECLNKLNDGGFEYLKYLSAQDIPFIANSLKMGQEMSHEKQMEGEALMFSAGIGHRMGTGFRITKLGIELYTFGVAPIYK